MTRPSPILIALASIALIAAAGVWCPSHAHPEIELALEALLPRIQAEPANAELYWHRGELYRQHLQFAEAGADYSRAERLDPALLVVALGRAEIALATGKPETALAHADSFLGARPDTPEGLQLRARALLALGRPAEAEVALSRRLTRLAAPRPEDFLDLARTREAARPADVSWPIAALDAGLQRLGVVPTLQLAAIQRDTARGAWDDALQRTETLAPIYGRAERLHAVRADLLRGAGRSMEAMASYALALEAIESLPQDHRRVSAMVELEGQIRMKLAATAASVGIHVPTQETNP